MSGSVLDAIAHPTTISPNLLQSYGQGQQIARQVWDNRQNQANQLAGQAFQNSIDPATGLPNQAQLNKNLIAAGPGVALAAQASSQTGLTNAGDSQTQALKGLTAQSTALDSLGPNASYSDVVGKLKEGLSGGWLQPAEAQSVLVGMPQGDDPQSQATRAHILQTVGDQVRTASERLQSQYGAPVSVNDGQVNRGGVANQRTGALTVPGAAPVPGNNGVQLQTGPEFNANQNNRYIPDPKNPGQFIQVPIARGSEAGASGVAPPLPGTPGTPSAQPAPIPYSGAYRPRGTVVGAPAAAPGATTPGGPTAAPAPSYPGPDPTKPPPGYLPGSIGGVTPPGQAQPTPQPTTAAAAPPAVNPATGLPAGTNLAAPPQGQPDMVATGNKIYTDAAAAMPAQRARLLAGESALQALQLAGTGPGTGTVAKIKAFFEAQGTTAPPQGNMSDVDYRQVLAKNLLRFAQTNGATAGTDLGLETQLHSNANADDMLPNANRHVLVQDLGVLRRDMSQTDAMPQGAAAIDHVKTFGNTMDARAFSFGDMSPAERSGVIAQLNAQDLAVDKTGQSHPNMDKFRASLNVALKSGRVQPDPASAATAPAAAAPVSVQGPNLLTAPRQMVPTN